MKKITILLFAMVLCIGANAQDELLFDGSATPDGQQFFRQGPSFNPFGSNQTATDDGTGNMVLEIERTTNAGAGWHALPLLDAAAQGVVRNIGDGGTFPGLRLRVRTTRNGNSTISARVQGGAANAVNVTVTGGDGTNYGAWQTIVLDCTTFPAANARPEFLVDPVGSATTPPAAAYSIQFDDIWAITAATLGTDDKAINNLTVFPNPTTGKVNVKGTGINVKSVEVYNVIGALVAKSTDLTGLVNGVYFLKINTDKGSLTERVVKQ